MKCQNCGAEIRDGIKFCPKCGSKTQDENTVVLQDGNFNGSAPFVEKKTPAEYFDANDVLMQSDPFAVNPNMGVPSAPVVNQPPKKPKKKVKKGKIIACVVLGSILALAIALVVLFFTSPAYSVYKDMSEGNAVSASKTYRNEVDDNFIQEKLLELLLKDRVAEVVADYNAGNIDYKKAVEQLEALEKMGFASAKDKIKEVTVSNDAANALEKADEFYKKGDYVNAISEYLKVPSNSEDYQTAQAKLDEICPKYIESVVEKAEEYASNEQYKDAITYIDAAYDILPDGAETSELDTLRNTSLMNYQTQVAKDVTDYVAAKKYAEAFSTLDGAIDFTGEQYFKDLKATTEKDYVTGVIAEADALLEKKNHTAAKKVVDDALAILPNNSELSAKLSEIEKSAPVSLATLTPINGGWTWDNETPTDPFGVTHTDIANYAIFSGGTDGYVGNYYAEYRLYGKYSSLTGDMVAFKDMPENGKCQVKIYADDTLVCVTPEIGRKTDVTDFTADIVGADYIKIEIIVDKGDKNSGWYTEPVNSLILMDVLLWS